MYDQLQAMFCTHHVRLNVISKERAQVAQVATAQRAWVGSPSFIPCEAATSVTSRRFLRGLLACELQVVPDAPAEGRGGFRHLHEAQVPGRGGADEAYDESTILLQMRENSCQCSANALYTQRELDSLHCKPHTRHTPNNMFHSYSTHTPLVLLSGQCLHM